MLTDDEKARVEPLITYQGGYKDVEKLSLERFARTLMEPIDCLLIAMKMQEVRRYIGEERRKRGQNV